MPAFSQRRTETRLTKRQKRVLKQEGVLDNEANINAKGFAIDKNIQPMTKTKNWHSMLGMMIII